MDDQFINSNIISLVHNYQEEEISSLNEYLNKTKLNFLAYADDETDSVEDCKVTSSESSQKVTIETISPILSSGVLNNDELTSNLENSPAQNKTTSLQKISTIEIISPITSKRVLSKVESISIVENSPAQNKTKSLEKTSTTETAVTSSLLDKTSDDKHDHKKLEKKSLYYEPPLKKPCIQSQSKESSGINVSDCMDKSIDITKKTPRNDVIEQQLKTILTMKEMGLEAPKTYQKENCRPVFTTSTQELVDSQEASQESVGTKFLQQELAAQWGSDDEEEKAFESHYQHFAMLQRLHHHLPEILRLPSSYV